jgi:hypothetical protein
MGNRLELLNAALEQAWGGTGGDGAAGMFVFGGDLDEEAEIGRFGSAELQPENPAVGGGQCGSYTELGDGNGQVGKGIAGVRRIIRKSPETHVEVSDNDKGCEEEGTSGGVTMRFVQAADMPTQSKFDTNTTTLFSQEVGDYVVAQTTKRSSSEWTVVLRHGAKLDQRFSKSIEVGETLRVVGKCQDQINPTKEKVDLALPSWDRTNKTNLPTKRISL